MQLESGTMLGQATQYTVDARQNPTDLSSVGMRWPSFNPTGFPDVMPVGMIMIWCNHCKGLSGRHPADWMHLVLHQGHWFGRCLCGWRAHPFGNCWRGGFWLECCTTIHDGQPWEIKKNLWKVQVLHLVLQVSGEHEFPCCQSGAWCWVQPGKWPGSDSVEGIKNEVNPSNPTNLRAILMRVALMQGGLHLKFSTTNFTSCHLHSPKSFSLSQVKSKKAKQMKPKMMNPWHQLYQMIFPMTWPRYPTPVVPIFVWKKNDTPKKNRSSVGRMRLSQSALDGLQACLVLQASFLRTENQDIVTLSSKCWYFLAQPALWEDVLDGCILLRSQFQYQMSNWKSKTNVWSNAVGTIWGGVGSTSTICV